MQRIKAIEIAEHHLTICNSCRYCEGFCAVFPAMEKRLSFSTSDINYLANLCHNCGECYYACQYAPPHEFNVNIPQSLAAVRNNSYEIYAWPRSFSKLFRRNAFLVNTLLVILISLFLLATVSLSGNSLFATMTQGNFYHFIPHTVLSLLFGLTMCFSLFSLFMGFLSFWKNSGERLNQLIKPLALWDALKDVLKLTYLDDNGHGCTYPNEYNSMARKWFHHFTFYGFILCFAATAVATFYHYFWNYPAPYPFFSLPVLLGTLGGIGLIIGPIGLWYLKTKRDPATSDLTSTAMDVSFIVLLIVISTTGLTLLALRHTPLLGVTFCLHLGAVMTFFLMLPYCKFVHGLYRGAALVKYALEKRQPKSVRSKE